MTNVAFDEKKNIFKVTFENKTIDEKLYDAGEIYAMMLTPGWTILSQYLDEGKEDVLKAGMNAVSNRVKRQNSDIKMAILKGFYECRAIPERIVQMAKQYQEMEDKRKEELLNDAGKDEDE